MVDNLDDWWRRRWFRRFSEDAVEDQMRELAAAMTVLQQQLVRSEGTGNEMKDWSWSRCRQGIWIRESRVARALRNSCSMQDCRRATLCTTNSCTVPAGQRWIGRSPLDQERDSDRGR